jgi:hypothetical protein
MEVAKLRRRRVGPRWFLRELKSRRRPQPASKVWRKAISSIQGKTSPPGDKTRACFFVSLIFSGLLAGCRPYFFGHPVTISIFLANRKTEHGSGLGRWRWVVERTFAWLNQFRRLRVRYRRAIELNPNFDEAHHQLGFVYLHIGMLDKAQQEIEKALAINPGNTLARYRLGVIDMCRAKYAEAFQIFNSTPLEQNPELLAFYSSNALFRLGRNEDAPALIERYFKDYSKDKGGMVTNVKAIMLAKAGKNSEAEATIQHAIEIGRGYAHFHHTSYNIASAYALMNEPKQTMKWLQVTADEGFPNYPLFEGDASVG